MSDAVLIAELVASADPHNSNKADQWFQWWSSGPRFYSEASVNLQSMMDYAVANKVSHQDEG
jgi:hypothetical protein